MQSVPKGANVIWSPQPGPQTRAIRSSVPDLLFGGARGGGKTDFLLGDWLGHAATHQAGARGLIVRRTMPELDDVIRRSRELYIPLGCEFKEQARTWLMPGGGELRMRYLESEADADRYQGHAYSWLAIDEAGNYAASAVIDKLRATLRSAHGVPTFLRLTANPGGPGHEWMKKRYVTPSPPNIAFTDPVDQQRRIFIPSKLDDNQILVKADPTYRQRLAASGPPHLVKAWLDGSWDIVPDGNFFTVSKINRGIPVPKIDHLYQAWDLAVTEGDHARGDYSACATMGRDHVGRYWLLDVEKGRWSSDKLVDRMIAKYRQFSPLRVWVEGGPIGKAIQPWLIKRMQDSGVWLPYEMVQTGRQDKVARATPLRAIVENGALYVPEAAWLGPLLMDFAMFPTEGAHDDTVDACSWVASQIQNMKKSTDHTPLPKLPPAVERSQMVKRQLQEHEARRKAEARDPLAW